MSSSLASTQPDSTGGATVLQGPRPDPGLFTRAMGLHKVQLQLVLLWALVWAQVAGSACPSCGGPTLAPQAERALVLKLAKQQILEGLQLTSRPRMTHPPPQGGSAPKESKRLESYGSRWKKGSNSWKHDGKPKRGHRRSDSFASDSVTNQNIIYIPSCFPYILFLIGV